MLVGPFLLWFWLVFLWGLGIPCVPIMRRSLLIRDGLWFVKLLIPHPVLHRKMQSTFVLSLWAPPLLWVLSSLAIIKGISKELTGQLLWAGGQLAPEFLSDWPCHCAGCTCLVLKTVSDRGDQMVLQIYDKSKCLPVGCAHKNPRVVVQRGWGMWNPQSCLKIVRDAQGARFQVGAWQLPWARLLEVVFKDVLGKENFILSFVSKSAHEEIASRSAGVHCSEDNESTQHNLILSLCVP